MSALKLTMQFQMNGQRWHEVYYTVDLGVQPVSYIPLAKAIANARHKCNAFNVQLEKYSIADTAVKQLSIVLKDLNETHGGLNLRIDVPDAALRMKMQDVDRLFSDNHFLHGLPDEMINFEEDRLIVHPTLQPLLAQFTIALAQGSVAIKAKRRDNEGQFARKRIDAIFPATSGRAAINIPGHGYPGGGEVVIKGCKFGNNPGINPRRYNRRHIVIPADPVQFPGAEILDWFEVNVRDVALTRNDYTGHGGATLAGTTYVRANFFSFPKANSRSVGSSGGTRGRRKAVTRGVF